MTASLSVRIDDRELQRVLKRTARAVGSRKMMRAIGARQHKFVMDNFSESGKEQRWEPLSRNTIAARRKGSSKPLLNTGRLRQSFTYQVSGSGKSVRVGTRSKIAQFHELGTAPYVIEAKNKKLLKFATAGGVVFAKKVNHPGLPARKMLPSKRMAKKLALSVAKAMIRKTIRGRV